jgi:hypothetical protein
VLRSSALQKVSTLSLQWERARLNLFVAVVVLVAQGSALGTVYLLVQGKLNQMMRLRTGRSIQVGELEAGAILGFGLDGQPALSPFKYSLVAAASSTLVLQLSFVRFQ